MIRIKYKELFEIEILHSFYTSGKCADLVLAPTAGCSIQMQQLGLRFLPTVNGGKVFAKVDTVAGTDFIRQPLPVGINLSFTLQLVNRNFENFTDITLLKPQGNRYYFNNIGANISGTGFPLLVENTASKIVSDDDLLPFISNSFSYEHHNAAPTQSSVLQFIDSGEIFEQTLSNHQNVFNFNYDLKKTTGGRAKFFVEGIEKSFFYVTDAAINADVFALIDIFYSNSLNAAYQFLLPDNSVQSKQYKIAFKNRQTKWRYRISKKYNQAITNVTVGKTTGIPILFTAEAGAPAGQFFMASNTAIPLNESPITGIKLADQTNKIIIANLPNPSQNLVKAEGADLFSEMIITI
jgi:hypothetical protein